ncbi:MAG: hypothetical protein AAGF47_12030 [Planctomycetota bacterium]
MVENQTVTVTDPLESGTGSTEATATAEGRADAVAIGEFDGDPEGLPCEQLVERLTEENAALRAQLSEMESAMALSESRHELERALVDAGVVDLETALVLAGPGLEGGRGADELAAELVAGKPFLFAGGSAPGRQADGSSGRAVGRLAGSSMGMRRGSDRTPLSALADEARRTGDRGALTRYLRRRRLG